MWSLLDAATSVVGGVGSGIYSMLNPWVNEDEKTENNGNVSSALPSTQSNHSIRITNAPQVNVSNNSNNSQQQQSQQQRTQSRTSLRVVNSSSKHLKNKTYYTRNLSNHGKPVSYSNGGSNTTSRNVSTNPSRRTSIDSVAPQLIKQSSHYHRHYTKLPIYAEIGNQCETYLKSILDIQPGLIPPPIDPIVIEQCNIHGLEFNTLLIIFNYLPLETLIALETCKYDVFVTLVNHVIYDRSYLRCAATRGFTDRKLVWPWLVAYSIEGYQDLYVKKLLQWRQVESGDIDAPEFVMTYRGLAKDIHRTFSNNRVMNLREPQQRQLQTLLGVYSLLDPEVGYVQGMNFIAGLIVLAIDSELDAFGIFCQIMKRNKSPPHNPLLHNVPPILRYKRLINNKYDDHTRTHKHKTSVEQMTQTMRMQKYGSGRKVQFDSYNVDINYNQNGENYGSNSNNNNSNNNNNNNNNDGSDYYDPRQHRRKRTNNLTWYMDKTMPNGELLSFAYDSDENEDAHDYHNIYDDVNSDNRSGYNNNINKYNSNNHNDSHRSDGNDFENDTKKDEIYEDLEMLRRKKKYDYAYCGGGRVSKTGQYGYGVRDMFTECLPGCVVSLLQFEQLLQKYLPTLYQHMKTEGLHVQSFASEWFMTLFSYVLPLKLSFRIFDMFMIDGHKVLHRVGLCILTRAESELLTLSLDAMLMYLKAFPDSSLFISLTDESEGDSFIDQSLSFKVTNSALHQCAADLLAKTMVHVRMSQISMID